VNTASSAIEKVASAGENESKELPRSQHRKPHLNMEGTLIRSKEINSVKIPDSYMVCYITFLVT
jgi:hypothetical protein